MDKAVCKPGPPLEFSTTLKNVLMCVRIAMTWTVGRAEPRGAFFQHRR